MMIETKVQFTKNLEPFGELLQKMYEDAREILLNKSDEELQQIIEDTKQCKENNCWWAIYHMREVVAYEAKIILQNRCNGLENQ
jgi:hypothetical protein